MIYFTNAYICYTYIKWSNADKYIGSILAAFDSQGNAKVVGACGKSDKAAI